MVGAQAEAPALWGSKPAPSHRHAGGLISTALAAGPGSTGWAVTLAGGRQRCCGCGIAFGRFGELCIHSGGKPCPGHSKGHGDSIAELKGQLDSEIQQAVG